MGDGAKQLRLLRALATAALLIWLATLAFVSGPARWKFAHTYEHWIDGLENSLPMLTKEASLPVLGLGPSSLPSLLGRIVFWGLAWLEQLALLAWVWRAGSRQQLSECVLMGGALYGAGMLLAMLLVAFGLWLPFSLLWE
ncbi:MAG: hypothetical protein ACE5GX_04575 [Thermoanaerobaculia bacterium]